MNDDELLAAVRDAFEWIDPFGSLGLGLADDEYASVIKDMAERIGSGQVATPDLVREVLHSSFGMELLVTEEIADALAGCLRDITDQAGSGPATRA